VNVRIANRNMISFFFSFSSKKSFKTQSPLRLTFFDNSQKRELVAAGKLRQAFSTLLALLLLDGFYGPPLLTGSSIKCPICIRREEYSNYILLLLLEGAKKLLTTSRSSLTTYSYSVDSFPTWKCIATQKRLPYIKRGVL